MKIGLLILFTVVSVSFISCSNDNEESEMLQRKIDQFVKTKIIYDENLLDENQKIVVQKLF